MIEMINPNYTPEYINRDDALRKIASTSLTDLAFEMVRDLPAADVVERKTGYWIILHEETEGPLKAFLKKFMHRQCSVCGYKYVEMDESWVAYRFCPYCGSEMIREVDFFADLTSKEKAEADEEAFEEIERAKMFCKDCKWSRVICSCKSKIFNYDTSGTVTYHHLECSMHNLDVDPYNRCLAWEKKSSQELQSV